MSADTAGRALAAAALVAYRRSGNETVSVECRIRSGSGDRSGRVDIPVDAEITAAVFTDQVDELVEVLSGVVTAAGGTDVLGFAYSDNATIDPHELPAGYPVWLIAQPGQGSITWHVHGVENEIGATDWTRQLEAAGAAYMNHPDRALDQLPLMTAEDLERVRMFEGHAASEHATRCIPDIFRDIVRSRPHGRAVICDGQALTYAELDEMSERVASALSKAGVGANAVVGILVEPSVELVAAIVGVVKAGCAYLALDIDDPAARLAQVLDLADARVVLSTAMTRAAVPEDIDVRCVDLQTVLREASYERPVPVTTTAETVAYVSFTSGSTGEPKGVAVPHRGVTRLLCNPSWMSIDSSDVFIQISPIPFDASTIEIWGPLLNGATLHVYAKRPIDLAALAQSIAAERVSVLLLTTGLFHQMVSEHLDAFAAVRHVLTGGDVAQASRVRELMHAHPDIMFTNGYGPTENTSYTTCWTTQSPPTGSSVPIGPPITGTSVAVLDSALQRVPPGVCGELYAAGDGVAHGYIGMPARTAERFVADPVGGRPGARMYRTGDLVRWSAHGDLEFIGRVDRQVKVRGFRVELEHIEEELLRGGDVRHAVVLAQRDGGQRHRLLAYIVPVEPNPVDLERRLRAQLESRLPSYMVPWAIMVRDRLPLNRNGKVDRARLLPERHVPRSIDAEYVAPRNRDERALAELWADVLHVEPVGIDDNFFDLGGYSLLAAELLGRMSRELGIELTAGTLYRSPTIASLTAVLPSAS